jgi:Obg family GTPase CgtA-like protein
LANLEDPRVVAQLWKEMDRMGVLRALQVQGVKPGDTVRIGKAEFEWS